MNSGTTATAPEPQTSASAVSPRPSVAEAVESAPEAGSSRADSVDDSPLAPYLELTKPRIVALVLVTVTVGYLLGVRGAVHPFLLALVLLGTGGVAAGGSVWNQVLERHRDRRMRRTSSRPLPSGQVTVWQAVLFGTGLTVAGLGLLAVGPHPIAAGIAGLTFLLYAFVYTFAKPVTTLNTAIGAIPGALPPVIGWSAATGQVGIEGLALFLILFLWQFPHFLAIAWLHRADYARAGFRMLPGIDPLGQLTGRQAVGYALVLVPVGLLPTVIGLAGLWYFAGALGLGLYYLASAVRFWHDRSAKSARRLLKASILYLPALLLLLLLNPLPS